MSPTRCSAAALAALLFLAGCGAPEEAARAPAETSANPYDGDACVLGWSDLIPEGEDPRPVPVDLPTLGDVLDPYGGFPPSMPGGSSEHDPSSEGGTLADAQVGTFNTIPGLDGLTVRVPGFVVPLEMEENRVRSFLLVPYYGACIHAPPPPPNQTIFVESEEAVRFGRMSQAVWVEGELSAGRFRSDMGAAAYAIRLERLEPFEGRFQG